MTARGPILVVGLVVIGILSLLYSLKPGTLIPAGEPITAQDAKNHIGQVGTVCGKVSDSRFAIYSRGSPTFLNLDQPYPNEVFTVLIWAEYRSRFGSPEIRFREKEICVTGVITRYRTFSSIRRAIWGVPQIVVTEPSQITIKEGG
jgi:hypothetical protein